MCTPHSQHQLQPRPIDEYTAFHESFSYYYLLEPEERNEKLRDIWSDYFATQRMAKASGPLQLEDVAEAVPRLTSLRDLGFTWMQCPWEGKRRSGYLIRQTLSKRLAGASTGCRTRY